MMMCLSKWISATLAIVLLAGSAAASDAVSSGKVKSINADNQTFVLTDAADKDFTFKLGDNLVVNREGKESKGDLKPGDVIDICYDKGLATWTANYILVSEGNSKNCGLIHGTVKSIDTEKKEITFTKEKDKSVKYSMTDDAKVRVNMEESTMENVKIGDHALLVVNTVEDKSTIKCVMIKRAK